MDELRRERLSKLLSLMLRHKPQMFELELDTQGYAALDEVVTAAQQRFEDVNEDEILYIVNQMEKRRFEIKDNRIRARYGHSFPIDLGLDPMAPPEFLYYATVPSQIRPIMMNGLHPADRQFVHLSLTSEIATQVAKRRTDTPALFIINAKKAADAGIAFFDRNPVVLTTGVPSAFIELDASEEEAKGALYGRRKRRRTPRMA